MDRVQWIVFSIVIGSLLAASLGLAIRQMGDMIASSFMVVMP